MIRFIIPALALAVVAGAAESGSSIARVQEAIGLSNEQAQAVREIRNELREEVRPVLQDLRTAELELRREQGEASPDPTAVAMLEARAANSRGYLEVLRSQAAAEARAVLTPEQTATLAEIVAAEGASPLVMQAVRNHLIDRPEIAQAASRGRVNQGDFRSDGRRRP